MESKKSERYPSPFLESQHDHQQVITAPCWTYQVQPPVPPCVRSCADKKQIDKHCLSPRGLRPPHKTSVQQHKQCQRQLMIPYLDQESLLAQPGVAQVFLVGCVMVAPQTDEDSKEEAPAMS